MCPGLSGLQESDFSFAPESCLDGRSFYLRGLGRSVREVRCSTPADEAEPSAQGRGIANVPAAWVVRQTTSRQLRGGESVHQDATQRIASVAF